MKKGVHSRHEGLNAGGGKASPGKAKTNTPNSTATARTTEPVKARFIFDHKDKITDHYKTENKSLGQRLCLF